MFKWILRLFSCKSECLFNPQRDCPGEMFQEPWKLEDFSLKDKDLKALHKIFTKRRKPMQDEPYRGIRTTQL